MTSNLRPAWGGIVGPAAFVSAWIVGGLTRPRYSPVEDAISQLAALRTSTRPLMTAGFLGFGVAVPLYGIALRAALPGQAWKAAIGTGVATLGVAAFPLGASPTLDLVHGGFATAGYVTLAATPLLAARALYRSGRPRAAVASVAAGVACVACLAATVIGPSHGLLQRVGLTIGDAWLIGSALWMLSGGRASPGGRAGSLTPL